MAEHKRKRSCKKFDDYDSLVALYQSGMGTQEVADALGVGKRTVQKHLKIAGVEIRKGEYNRASHEALIARIESTSSPFVHYVYGNKKTGVTLKCEKCGQTFTYRSVWNVRFRCPNCEPVEHTVNTISDEVREQKKKDIQLAAREKTLAEVRRCKWCGSEFTEKDWYGDSEKRIKRRHHFCSPSCKSQYSRYDRRVRQGKAKPLSWKKIAMRDGYTCAICGEPVDINDYTVTDEGYFIAGANYPSADHIVPLAKGGSHTYDNAQLAHCLCNSMKRDLMVVSA